MRKEYECCVPKEIKDSFLNNNIRTRAIQQLIGVCSKLGINNYKIFYKEMIDQLEDIQRSEWDLWSKVIKMFPNLNPGNFTFKSNEFSLFYYEDDGEKQ